MQRFFNVDMAGSAHVSDRLAVDEFSETLICPMCGSTTPIGADCSSCGESLPKPFVQEETEPDLFWRQLKVLLVLQAGIWCCHAWEFARVIQDRYDPQDQSMTGITKFGVAGLVISLLMLAGLARRSMLAIWSSAFLHAAVVLFFIDRLRKAGGWSIVVSVELTDLLVKVGPLLAGGVISFLTLRESLKFWDEGYSLKTWELRADLDETDDLRLLSQEDNA